MFDYCKINLNKSDTSVKEGVPKYIPPYEYKEFFTKGLDIKDMVYGLKNSPKIIENTYKVWYKICPIGPSI